MALDKRGLYYFSLVSFLFLALCSARAQTPQLSWQQKEEFLRTAKIVSAKQNAKGITQTLRVTMSDGKITHDASVQRIDERKTVFQVAGASEVNFRDSYKFNV